MKTLSVTPRPWYRWKAEDLSFLHVLLVWGVTLTSLLIKKCQSWVGSADEDITLFLVGGKNCSWQLHEGHDGRFDGLGSKIGPKPPPSYH
jgi:hypothetical protein